MKLPEQRHELFAQALVAGYSQTESAKRAGFSDASAHNTGSRLLKNEDILARIQELRYLDETRENADVSVGSKPWIATETIAIIRQANPLERAFVAKPGEPTPDVKRDLPTALRGLEFLARLNGHLVDRKESMSTKLSANMTASMTPTQLNAVLRGELGTLPPAERQKLLQAMPELGDIVDIEPADPAQ